MILARSGRARIVVSHHGWSTIYAHGEARRPSEAEATGAIGSLATELKRLAKLLIPRDLGSPKSDTDLAYRAQRVLGVSAHLHASEAIRLHRYVSAFPTDGSQFTFSVS
jgi:hypothetical protein